MPHARRSLTSSARRVPEREQTRYLSSKEAAEPLKHVSRFLKGLALTRHDRTHQGPRVALAGPRRPRHCSASAFTAAHSRRSPGCGNSQPLQPQLVARARSCRQSSSAPRRTLRSPSLTMLSGRPTKQRYGDSPSLLQPARCRARSTPLCPTARGGRTRAAMFASSRIPGSAHAGSRSAGHDPPEGGGGTRTSTASCRRIRGRLGAAPRSAGRTQRRHRHPEAMAIPSTPVDTSPLPTLRSQHLPEGHLLQWALSCLSYSLAVIIERRYHRRPPVHRNAPSTDLTSP
jgi:hypothetical protein